MLEERVVLTQEILKDERVQAWQMGHPREWWAFENLGAEDELRVRLIAAILGEREDDALEDLIRYADALEDWNRARDENNFENPPSPGERRPMNLRILRMHLKREGTRKFFRVDFCTDRGWGGYFDTDNSVHIERLQRYRGSPQPVTVVAEVTHRPYDYFVVLGGHMCVV